MVLTCAIRLLREESAVAVAAVFLWMDGAEDLRLDASEMCCFLQTT